MNSIAMNIGFPFSEEEIISIVQAIEADLLEKPKIKFTLDHNWKLNFPNQPGVYAIFEKGEFVYIGETADIRERMRDVRRSYNHTFRKKIGKTRLNANIEGNLFAPETELALDNYMVENLEFTCYALIFGRKEVEARILAKYKDKLLNSVSLRGSKNSKV
jgi:hypothetical protein